MKYALIALLALAGCTAMPGVQATDDERAACKVSGCTVWTLDELKSLARRAFGEGYTAGKRSI